MEKLGLQEEVLRLRAIIQTATDGIITIDEEGLIQMVNPAAARIFDYQPDELIGQNIKILMTDDYEGGRDVYIHEFLETKINEIIGMIREVEGCKRDGTSFPFRLGVSEIKFSGRRTFVGIIQDLSEYHQITEALRKEKARLEVHLDVANNIFVVLDIDGNTLQLNRRGLDLLGYRRAEIIGHNWMDMIIPPASRKTIKERFKRQARREEPWREYLEDAILTKNGDIRIISWHNRLIINEQDEVEASLSSGVDITELKSAEENLKKLNSDLEKRVEDRTAELATVVKKLINANKRLEHEVNERLLAERALLQSEKELTRSLEKEKELGDLKSRFVAMASHEFKTPLSTILSSASLLGKYVTTEEQKDRDRHINKIKSAVRDLNGILNDFLSLGRLEEGKIDYQPSHFSFNAFAMELIDEIDTLLKAGQEIEFVGLSTELTLYLDRRLFKNSLINLLTNAIKYSKEGKKISLISRT
ncbi:MAG: PAS domain S-box protein, partial [Bacteroidota bacterium]